MVSSPTPDGKTEVLSNLSRFTQPVLSDRLRIGTSRQTQILPLSCCYSSWGPWAPCNFPDLPCSPDWQVQRGVHQTSGAFPLGPEQAAEGRSHYPQPPSGQQSQSANTYQGYQEAGERPAEPGAHSLKSPPTSLPSTTLGAHRPFCCGGQCSIISSYLLMYQVKPFPCPFRELF